MDDFYPETSRRLESEGRVLVDVQLDKDGYLASPVVVSSDQTNDSINRFEPVVIRLVSKLSCKATGPSVLGESAKGIFRLSFVFELSPGGAVLPYPVSDTQFTITGTRIRR